MKFIKFGFSIIELLIAMAIASALSGTLFMLMRQSSTMTKTVDTVTDFSLRAEALVRVIERDISGSTIPLTYMMQMIEKKQKQSKKTPQPTPTQGEANAQEQSDSQLAENKKDQKNELFGPEITKIYAATGDAKKLIQLTFITNNTLQGYWSSSIGQAKPNIARISYILEQKKNDAGKLLYTLKRKESPALEMGAFEADAKNSFYVVADNISFFVCSYITLSAAEDGTVESEKSFSWNSDELQKKELENVESKELFYSVVPRAVLISYTLAQEKGTATYSGEIIIPIYAEFDMVVPELQKSPEKKIDAKSQIQELLADRKQTKGGPGAPQHQGPSAKMPPLAQQTPVPAPMPQRGGLR